MNGVEQARRITPLRVARSSRTGGWYLAEPSLAPSLARTSRNGSWFAFSSSSVNWFPGRMPLIFSNKLAFSLRLTITKVSST